MDKFFLLILSLLLSVSVSAGTKRALIIGIGEQKDIRWTKINGDKDVPFVKEMLKNAGYKDISTLVNKQATKASIVQSFKDLTNKCNKGDVIYIHFSGHGQLVTDVNGDEKDGWDEAWIPYDAYLKYGKEDKGEKHLTDDEINVLLTSIRNKIGNKGKLLVVVDAGHSGDSSRGNSDDSVVVRGVKDEFVIPTKRKMKTAKAPERWITLSACQDFQLNQEIIKPQVGKLTYALYKTLQKGKIDFKAIESFMDKYEARLPQNPMLTGETSKYKLNEFFR